MLVILMIHFVSSLLQVAVTILMCQYQFYKHTDINKDRRLAKHTQIQKHSSQDERTLLT